MMNIIQLRDTLFRGGIEVLLLDVCKNGKTKGLNFFVVTFNEGDLVNDFIENGIEVIKIKRNKPIDLKVIKELRKIIIEKNIGQPKPPLRIIAPKGAPIKKNKRQTKDNFIFR